MEKHKERLPPLGLPIAYFLSGHVALLCATLALATEPESFGFFLLPRLIAVVHLVTLGWITVSIFGALYIVAPMALRMTLRPNKLDVCICIAMIGGAAAVAAHFWISRFAGVLWSGVVLAVAFLLMTLRLIGPLRAAESPTAVRFHVAFAFFNLVLATVLGAIVAGTHESRGVDQVFAHAHLAVLGWGLLLVFGVAYRLVAMYLPAKPPEGRSLWLSLVLLEAGALGTAASFWWHKPLARWAAVAAAAGILVFFANLVSMLRNRRPPPTKRKTPDIGILHTFQAFLYLLLATGVGLYLVFSDPWHLGWIMAYGTFALAGFFGQLVIGISMRMIPMFSWLQAWAGSDYKELPKGQYDMPVRAFQYLTLATWTLGVPVLAWGLGHGSLPLIEAGGWLLFGGTAMAAANTAVVLRHARRR